MRAMARKLRVQYPVAMYHVVNMEHLLARHKGDPHKVQIARELRAHTTMPLAWIAEHLHMGSRGYVAWLLQRSTAVSSGDTQGFLAI